jgi:hypothetical protein
MSHTASFTTENTQHGLFVTHQDKRSILYSYLVFLKLANVLTSARHLGRRELFIITKKRNVNIFGFNSSKLTSLEFEESNENTQQLVVRSFI